MGADLRIIEVLNDFIEVLHDYDEYFRRAAECDESSDLKRMVMDFAAAERGRPAGELQAEIKRFGEPDPADTGSLTGSLNRTLMGLRAALPSGRDRTLHAS